MLATVVLALFYPATLGGVVAGAGALLTDYTVLIAVGVIGLLMAVLAYRHGDRMSTGVRVLVAGVVAGLLAASGGIVLNFFVAPDSGLAYEVPKGVTYYAPTLLAIAGAVGMAAIWTRR